MNRKQATRLTILAKLRQGEQFSPLEFAVNQGVRHSTINDVMDDLSREGLAKRIYGYMDWNSRARKFESYSLWTAGPDLDTVATPVTASDHVSAATASPVAKSPVTANYGRTTDDLLLDAMEPTAYDGWLAEEMTYAGGR